MTTILSLASRDFIVLGCDSLATQSTALVNPQKLINSFFANDGTLLIGQDGKPILNYEAIWREAGSYPVNQLPSVRKLFDLSPKKAALLFAGASRIGNLSIKNLVESLKRNKAFKDYKSYTMKGIADRLSEAILKAYEDEYQNEWQRPSMEILLSGYSTGHHEPEVFRLMFNYNYEQQKFVASTTHDVARGEYNLLFGGQYDVIQRVVQGVDFESFLSLKSRCYDILNAYRTKVIQAIGTSVDPSIVPPIDTSSKEFDLFGDDFGGIRPAFTDLGSLSEQAGIDLVWFLINTMIKSQEFSTSIPTVGGDVHIAMISSDVGFRWISKEELRTQDHATPRFTNHAPHSQD